MINTFKYTAFAAFIALSAFASLPAAALTIASTFDTDAEGWTGNPGEGAVAWVAAGGNPGGHIRVTDIGVGGVPFGSGAFAGPAFLGDLSAYDGGTLSIDMATFAGGGGTFGSFGALQLSGAGDVAIHDLAVSAPPFNTWQTFTAPLTAAAWGKSQAEWDAILGNVTSIGVPTDAFDGGDTIGIDNFSVTSPAEVIPLPATAWLMVAGVGGLAWMRRRQRACLAVA